MSPPDRCYHCDLPIPPDAHWPVVIRGVSRAMCCPGCQAVASAIVKGGLDDFYRLRTEPAARPDENTQYLDPYALPEVEKRYLANTDDDLVEVSLLISGITCAACVWLLEHTLHEHDGVRKAQINFSTHRAQVVFDPTVTSLKAVLEVIARIGYNAQPFDTARHEQALYLERKQRLKRLSVAGLLGMQIMMLAIALYFGEHEGMDPLYRAVLRWTSLFLAVPVILYCATPFFQKAWHNLRGGYAGMDLPVSLGIGVAFIGSVVATWTGAGQVYYESVAMFVFFLLGARYLEFMARQRAGQALDGLAHATPATALRIKPDDEYETVVVDALTSGDRVLVRPGDIFPADGILTKGTTSADESLLSGESRPLRKIVGDEIVGGSSNIDGSVEMEITRTGAQMIVSRVLNLAEQAHNHKPRAALLADHIAHWFVLGVLILAGVTAIYWWQTHPDLWWGVTVSVLVVTCPCALSLATPTALVSAVSTLSRAGLVVMNSNALEQLSHATHIVFDKTGTLTKGCFSVQQVSTHTTRPASECLQIAAALEQHSSHPIAHAIRNTHNQIALAATDVASMTGAGVAGTINGERYFLGRLGWISEQIGSSEAPKVDTDHTVVYLADADCFLATFVLDDPLRPDSSTLVTALQEQGYELSVCSGDHHAAVARVAQELGINSYRAEQRPGDKLQYVRDLQRNGAIVLAIGDGINDAPLLAAADVSIAIGQGAPLAQDQASLVLLNETLARITQGLSIAKRAMRVVKQNLLWAIAYNLLALPAAMLGWVPPWLAALGMSFSSLVVVANASRLRRDPQIAKPNSGRLATQATSVSALSQGSV